MDLPEDQLYEEGINKGHPRHQGHGTDLRCEPLCFQRMKLHLPHNTDRTVTPKNGRMVELRYRFETSEGVAVDLVNTGVAHRDGRDAGGRHLATWAVLLGWAVSRHDPTRIDVHEIGEPGT